jgi:lipopolysaccharide transport system ATP-binding protein
MDLVFSLDKFIPGLSLQFTIYDSRGSAVATFDSATLTNRDEIDPILKNKIVCRINEVPLVPGKYRLNTALKNVYGIQDHLDGAFYFSVRQGNIDGRPIREGSHFGSVHINHQWYVPEK